MSFEIPIPPSGEPVWPYDLYQLLRKERVSQISYVPDAGHKVLINLSLADPEVHSIPLTTEEEGVAMSVGAHLGGERHVVLMQSSGVGNCINMLSLPRLGKFPFLALISMRGDFGEGNPWQMPMGKSIRPVLEACDIVCLKVEEPSEVLSTVSAAITMAFQCNESVCVLLGQKLLGAKKF